MRARGSAPRSAAFFSDATITAAAPSEICEALPAVTVPSDSKTGLSLASFSTEVSARKPSSAATPSFCLTCSAERATSSGLK